MAGGAPPRRGGRPVRPAGLPGAAGGARRRRAAARVVRGAADRPVPGHRVGQGIRRRPAGRGRAGGAVGDHRAAAAPGLRGAGHRVAAAARGGRGDPQRLRPGVGPDGQTPRRRRRRHQRRRPAACRRGSTRPRPARCTRRRAMSYYAHNDHVTRVWWIQQWPRSTAGAPVGFLQPLLLGLPHRHTVSLLFRPVPYRKAARQTNTASSSVETRQHLNEKIGRRRKKTDDRELADINRREDETVDGYATFSVGGFVSVTAPGREHLEAVSADTESAINECNLGGAALDPGNRPGLRDGRAAPRPGPGMTRARTTAIRNRPAAAGDPVAGRGHRRRPQGADEGRRDHHRPAGDPGVAAGAAPDRRRAAGPVPRPRRRRDQGGTARRVHPDAPRPVLVGHRQPVADRRPADRAGPVLRRAFLPRPVAAPQTRPDRRHRHLHLRGHRLREIRRWPRRSSPGTATSGGRSWCPATSEANGSPWCRPSTAPCCGWARGCRTGSTPWPCPSKPAGISRAAVVADRAHPLGGAAGRVDRNGAARQPGPDPDRDHRDRGGHHRGHQVLRGLREPGPARTDPPAPHRRPAAEPHPDHGRPKPT